MKFQIDPEADALYLKLLNSPAAFSEETAPGVVLDYHSSHELVGVEMLYLSKRKKSVTDSLIEIEGLPEQALAVHEPQSKYPAE